MEVNDETTWAPEVIAYLERHYGLFLGWETRSGATVATPADYDKAICGLREVLNLCDLHGYHCSRLTETEIEHILRNGMQLPNGKMLHDRIMAAHASGLFDATVATRLTSANS